MARMATGIKGKCPLSSVRDKDGKLMRKVRISDDRCADPTTANQRKAFQYKQKQDQMARNMARGEKATKMAAEKARKEARARGAMV